MKTSIGQQMQAVLFESIGAPTVVRRIPIPQPGPGQVLVRMAAAPINPSDLGFMQGGYEIQTPFPQIPGFEGSGTVVAAGSGILPHLWMGKRVACSTPPPNIGGTWAEYLVTSAASCVPLPKHVTLEQGSTLLINPMTAFAFLDIAKRGKHAAIVNNAAASALGRMILRLGQMDHIPMIHIVRRTEQASLLRSMGAEYVLDSSLPDFTHQLRVLANQLKATLILDPVGGEQAQVLLDAAPHSSLLIQYASLSGKKYDPALQSSLSDDKHMMGFFLPEWMAKRSRWQLLMDIRQIRRYATTVFQTTIQQRFPLSQVNQAIECSQANPARGKVLLIADPEMVSTGKE
jgi:NADPH:quinone reductase